MVRLLVEIVASYNYLIWAIKFHQQLIKIILFSKIGQVYHLLPLLIPLHQLLEQGRQIMHLEQKHEIPSSV